MRLVTLREEISGTLFEPLCLVQYTRFLRLTVQLQCFFPPGMSFFPCARIDSWSPSKSHACEEVMGQTREIVESHNPELLPAKEFKETRRLSESPAVKLLL